MSYTIESIKDWPSGDTRVFPFIVPDEDSENADARKDITGADITWSLKNIVTSDVVLSLDDPDVNINVTDRTNGEFQVEVEKGATDGLEGKYREIIRIEDDAGNRSTWASRIEIDKID